MISGKRRKKLIYVFLAMVFSMSSLSIGYGFWTDRLDLEGESEVRFSVNIIDDIIDQPISVSPQALQLIEDPINNIESSDSNLPIDGSIPLLPEIVEPEIIEPDPIEPEIDVLEPIEPEIVEPEVTEPELVEPDTVVSESDKPVAEDVQSPEE